MNIKVDFDNIVVKEDKNDFNVKVLMLKGEKGDASEGENNVIEKVQVNGTDLPVTNKTVNVTVPIVDSAISSSSTNPVENKAIYNALSDKVDTSSLNNYYEISEVDGLLNGKVDNSTLDDYYTKTQSYSQSETNSLLDDKADVSIIETINETLLTKANTDDVATTYATKTELNNDVSNLSTRINSLASGSPKVVSSTSAMTDAEQIYVLSSNMHIYYYDGTQFVDSNVQYSTDTSIMSGYYSLLNTQNMWNLFGSDFNNLVGNKIYFCSQPASVTLSNEPYSHFNGTVMCFNNRENTTSGLVQFAYNPSRGLYMRQCWGTTWYSWKQVATLTDLEQYRDVLKGYGTLVNTVDAWGSFSNDFNNLTNNRIYTVQNTTGVTQLHSPTGSNVSGTLLSYNYYSASRDGHCQLFINAGNKHIYYRIKWGSSWSDWTDLISSQYINPILNNGFNELYKAFDTVGVIGDSLASGESAYKDNNTTKYIDIYEKSWGQFMARDSGNTYYNFSKGGLTTRSWFTTTEGYPTASDGNHKCKAYIIALGVNDQPLGSDYIGTSSDINLSDYTQNADTFYGNYAKIIQTMKIQQPKAKFFLLTVPNVATSFDDINTAIRYMATIFDNVYVIDLRNDYISYFSQGSFIINNRRSGHFNAIAYEYIAKMFEQWISQYMYDNYSEFNQVEFIGTEYEWID